MALPDTNDRVRGCKGDRPAEALALLRSALTPQEAATFGAELDALPPNLVRAIGEAVVYCADNAVTFQMESVLPSTGVLDYARRRRVDLSFEYREDGVTVSIAHTMRHPTWLPALTLPATR